MNNDERKFIKDFSNKEMRKQVEEEITTLYDLGFQFRYSGTYWIDYIRRIQVDGRGFPIVIRVRNCEYDSLGPHIKVMVNGTRFCDANNLEQALEEITK